jgi:hypothetical protein
MPVTLIFDIILLAVRAVFPVPHAKSRARLPEAIFHNFTRCAEPEE